MRIVSVPCLSDNFAYLVTCPTTGATAVVDPGEPGPIETALAAAGLTPSAIWCTHHHPDHVGGVAALAARFPGVAVIGHASDAPRIAGLTRGVVAGDRVALGALTATIIENPGHTSGAISLLIEADGAAAVFTGDTLFGAGCGRMFEGTPEMMSRSLARLAAEAPTLEVYFGHEYTVANLKFAAAVDPDEPAVAARAAAAAARRAAGQPTTPSTIELERATNPFLRGHVAAVAAAARAADPTVDPTDLASVFGGLRRWKDRYR